MMVVRGGRPQRQGVRVQCLGVCVCVCVWSLGVGALGELLFSPVGTYVDIVRHLNCPHHGLNDHHFGGST